MDINKLKRDAQEKYRAAEAILDKVMEEHRSSPTPEETAQINTLQTEADAVMEMVKQSENLRSRIVPGTESPRTTPPAGAVAEEKPKFRTFSDQVIANYRDLKQHGGVITDTRQRALIEQRAISGLGETVPSDGGVFVQTDFVAGLLQRTYDTGVLVQRCFSMPITAESNSCEVNAVDETSRVNGSRFGGLQTYWGGEGDSVTASKPKFRKIKLALKKLFGLMYLTDELLQDAAALQAYCEKFFGLEFGYVMQQAILSGVGAAQPLGILNSPALVTVAKETGQTAKTITWENVSNMWSRMWAPSLGNTVWLINQDCFPQLFSMSLKIGTAGVPVWLPAGGGANGSPYSTLFGRPVIPIEQASTLGTPGDILLVDPQQYIWATKGDLQTAVSIHVRFLNDETVVRFILRVDGQPWWNTALTPATGSANTLSPFVSLAIRA